MPLFSTKPTADKLMDLTFQLRFTSKQFERESKKSEKDEKKEKEKVKQCIEKGNLEGARIHAQNAIRKRSEATNYLRLASRLDAVGQRVNTAIKMNQVTKTMGSLVKGMDSVLNSMDVNKISQVMSKFEEQFEDLDVTTQYMDDSMAQSSSLSTPEGDVNNLMAEVADEHGLNVSESLSGVKTGSNQNKEEAVHADDLTERLANLKGQ